MSSPTQPRVRAVGVRARAAGPDALLRGILVVRWCVLAWLVVVVASGVARLPDPALGWVALVLTGSWTVYLTLARPVWGTRRLVADAVVCALLLVVAAVAPTLATVYPVAAALSWGARRGLRGGAGAGAGIGAVFVTAHVVQGLVLDQLDERLLDVLGDAFSLVLAGAGVGLVSMLMRRSTAELAVAQADRLRAREDAARLAEREEIGRQVHDSVLQVLALIHKRGRELAEQAEVTPAQVAALAELAAEQERALRDFILRPGGLRGTTPDGGPTTDGLADLARRLEDGARRHVSDLDVSVSAVGDLLLPAAVVSALGAAVDQALGNVVRHAGTRRAWVFAEYDDGEVAVTVRDDGCGFVFDEDALRAAGRLGLLRSIGGRVEQLGGRLQVDTAPGRGTELELRVPVGGTAAAAKEHLGRGGRA